MLYLLGHLFNSWASQLLGSSKIVGHMTSSSTHYDMWHNTNNATIIHIIKDIVLNPS